MITAKHLAVYRRTLAAHGPKSHLGRMAAAKIAEAERESAEARLHGAAQQLLDSLKKHVAHTEQTIKDIGGCDHDTGICCFGLFADVAEARELIDKVEKGAGA